jgi:hypothetical protein
VVSFEPLNDLRLAKESRHPFERGESVGGGLLLFGGVSRGGFGVPYFGRRVLQGGVDQGQVYDLVEAATDLTARFGEPEVGVQLKPEVVLADVEDGCDFGRDVRLAERPQHPAVDPVFIDPLAPNPLDLVPAGVEFDRGVFRVPGDEIVTSRPVQHTPEQSPDERRLARVRRPDEDRRERVQIEDVPFVPLEVSVDDAPDHFLPPLCRRRNHSASSSASARLWSFLRDRGA